MGCYMIFLFYHIFYVKSMKIFQKHLAEKGLICMCMWYREILFWAPLVMSSMKYFMWIESNMNSLYSYVDSVGAMLDNE